MVKKDKIVFAQACYKLTKLDLLWLIMYSSSNMTRIIESRYNYKCWNNFSVYHKITKKKIAKKLNVQSAAPNPRHVLARHCTFVRGDWNARSVDMVRHQQSGRSLCATCSTPPTNSSTIKMISKPSLQQTPHLRSRTCWFQRCTYHGNSVPRLSHSGARTTHSLGSTPKRCDVPLHENVLFICIYLSTCIVAYIHSNKYMYAHTWIHINICTAIYSYVYKPGCKHRYVYEHIYIRIYTRMCMYTCLNIYNENVENLKDSLTD